MPGAPVDAALWNLAERLIATAPPEIPAQDANAPRATFPRPVGNNVPAAPAPMPGAMPATMPSAGRVRLVRLPNGQTIAVPFDPQTGLPMLSGAVPYPLPAPTAMPAVAAPPSAFAPASAPPNAGRPFTLVAPAPPAASAASNAPFALPSIAFGADRLPVSAPPPVPDRGAAKASFSILRPRTEADAAAPARAPVVRTDLPAPLAAKPKAIAETLPSAAPTAAPTEDDDWDDEPRPGISILGWLGVAVAIAGAALVAGVVQGWI